MSDQQKDAIESKPLSIEAYELFNYLLSYISAYISMSIILSSTEDLIFDIKFISEVKIQDEKKVNVLLKELVDKSYLILEKGIYSIDPIFLAR